MGNFLFTCPSTNLNVQHWRDEDDEDTPANEYEVVMCRSARAEDERAPDQDHLRRNARHWCPRRPSRLKISSSRTSSRRPRPTKSSTPHGRLGVGEALPSILGMKDPCLAALSGQSPPPAGARLRSADLQIFGRFLATVRDDLEAHLRAFLQAGEASPFHRRDVDEHVPAAAVRLNEAIALCWIEPLNCSGRYFASPFE
jgi:hypothetical protein